MVFYTAILLSFLVHATFAYWKCSNECGLTGAMSNLQQPMVIRIKVQSPFQSVCDKVCVGKLKSHMHMLMPEYETITDFQNEAFFMSSLTSTQFQTYCNNIYKPYDDCLCTCNASEKKAMLELVLAPTNFMCKDHFYEFYNSRSCAASIKTETMFTCEASYCLDKKRLVDANKNILMLQDSVPLDTNQEKRFLADNCRLVECLANCEIQILQQRCGIHIAKLQKDYVNVYISRLRSEYNQMGLTYVWPNECNVYFN